MRRSANISELPRCVGQCASCIYFLDGKFCQPLRPAALHWRCIRSCALGSFQPIDMSVEEMAPSDSPGPAPGFVGNLSDEQHTCLVQMWESYFDICDRARGNASKGAGLQEDKKGSNLKNTGIPNDDKAKDDVKRAQETQGMNELLAQYGSDALRSSWWSFVQGDSPDGAMLKFVRARNGDAGRALAMMATCLKWRLDSDVEGIIAAGDLENGKTIPKFTEQTKSGKIFSLGCTAKEQPIFYVIMKLHSIWGQPTASMQRYIVSSMETCRLFLHTPQDKATIFFDLKGFGIKQMDVVNLLFLVKVLEAYYPETLGTMYVSNAPWIFWGFWQSVKNLLDPVVRDKVKFISTPADTEGDVPADRMIEYCGGKVTTKFQYVESKEGENDAQKDTATKEALLTRHRAIIAKYEDVTRAWCKTGGNDERLQEQRAVLHKKLRLSQFELEPYIRGLTVYHRTGAVPVENRGVSVSDYEMPGEKTQRQVLGRKSCQKAVEQQLCNIAQGMTVQQAEDKTVEAIKNGTWGEWRVNDNSEEIRKAARESLEDLQSPAENTVDADAKTAPEDGPEAPEVKAAPETEAVPKTETAGVTVAAPEATTVPDEKTEAVAEADAVPEAKAAPETEAASEVKTE